MKLYIMCLVFVVTSIASFIVNRKKIREEFDAVLNHDLTGKQKADYEVAASLMSVEDVYAYLEENHFRDVSPRKRVKLLRNLSRTYNVDELIVLRRVREIYAIKKKS